MVFKLFSALMSVLLRIAGILIHLGCKSSGHSNSYSLTKTFPEGNAPAIIKGETYPHHAQLD